LKELLRDLESRFEVLEEERKEHGDLEGQRNDLEEQLEELESQIYEIQEQIEELEDQYDYRPIRQNPAQQQKQQEERIERERQEQYNRLIQAKNGATEYSLLQLARQFRAMNGYKDTTEQADWCDNQHRVLKECREKAERVKQEQREKELIERERLEKERIEQERQQQYGLLLHAKNRVLESDLPELSRKFRAMNGYKDTAELANWCDNQYRVLRKQRDDKERKEREIIESLRAKERRNIILIVLGIFFVLLMLWGLYVLLDKYL